jgi:hypothetical protein
VVMTGDEEIMYILCRIKDETDTNKFEFVYTKVSLYIMHLRDMYDDLILPEALPEDKVGDEEIVMAAWLSVQWFIYSTKEMRYRMESYIKGHAPTGNSW